MFKPLFFLFLALNLFNCGGNDVIVQETIHLKVKDCSKSLPDNVLICLDSVYNDSRCPKGIVCVWEGDAVAKLSLQHNDTVIPFSLHINPKFRNDTLIDGIRIKLLNVSPYPHADQPIEAQDYSVEIHVDRN